jgi:hypothetical protein
LVAERIVSLDADNLERAKVRGYFAGGLFDEKQKIPFSCLAPHGTKEVEE